MREVLARVKSKTRRGIDDNDYDHLLGMLGIVLRNLTEKEETEE
ncbi:hypothetical protein COHCIP112018_04787 [Cohnella sp. JJ-181]|nr:hypothetical protein COHCIP112018_04787 [Cohnella sp. JJ-181]